MMRPDAWPARLLVAALIVGAAFALLSRWPRYHRLHWSAQWCIAAALFGALFLLAGWAMWGTMP